MYWGDAPWFRTAGFWDIRIILTWERERASERGNDVLRANVQASGPVLTSRFLAPLNNLGIFACSVETNGWKPVVEKAQGYILLVIRLLSSHHFFFVFPPSNTGLCFQRVVSLLYLRFRLLISAPYSFFSIFLVPWGLSYAGCKVISWIPQGTREAPRTTSEKLSQVLPRKKIVLSLSEPKNNSHIGSNTYCGIFTCNATTALHLQSNS